MLWWSQVRLGIEKQIDHVDAFKRAGTSVGMSPLDIPEVIIEPVRVRPIRFRSAPTRIARSKRSTLAKKIAAPVLIVKDEIKTEAAAVAIPVEPSFPAIEADINVDQTRENETSTLLELHDVLRTRWISILESPGPDLRASIQVEDLDIQAFPKPDNVKVILAKLAKKQRTALPRKRDNLAAKRVVKLGTASPAPQLHPEVLKAEAKLEKPEQKATPSAGIKAPSADAIQLSAAKSEYPKLETPIAASHLPGQSEPTRADALNQWSFDSPLKSVSTEHPQGTPTGKLQPSSVVEVGAAQGVALGGVWISKPEYSNPPAPALSIQQMRGQWVAAASQVEKPQETKPQDAEGPETILQKPERTLSVSAVSFGGGAPNAAEVVAAFDWNSEIFGVKHSAISYEGRADGDQPQWSRYTAPTEKGFQDTLIFGRPGDTRHSAPLISTLNLQVIERVTGSPYRKGMGLVFGKLPANGKVEISARSERVIYFDEKNAVVSESDSGEKYFVFLNVEPGAHLAYWIDGQGVRRAATALSVEGASTYIDFTHARKMRVTGVVWDGDSAAEKALAGVEVRIVGQSHLVAITGRGGSFAFDDVWSFQDQPLYLETNAKNGFTHRYRIDTYRGGSVEGINLFRFGKKGLDQWITQLEGGISSESGIVISAYANQVSFADLAQLSPVYSSLSTSPVLVPETYTIAPDQRLEVKQPIRAVPARSISVQVPEGPGVLELQRTSGEVAWSELFVASKNVILVVGPN